MSIQAGRLNNTFSTANINGENQMIKGDADTSFVPSPAKGEVVIKPKYTILEQPIAVQRNSPLPPPRGNRSI
jgi:hypothetical protein